MKLLKTLEIIAKELSKISDTLITQGAILKEKKKEADSMFLKWDNACSYIKNVPTNEVMQDRIEREIEYHEKLKDVKANNPVMLEFIENISTNYAHLEKYDLLKVVEIFSEKYKIEKK